MEKTIQRTTTLKFLQAEGEEATFAREKPEDGPIRRQEIPRDLWNVLDKPDYIFVTVEAVGKKEKKND